MKWVTAGRLSSQVPTWSRIARETRPPSVMLRIIAPLVRSASATDGVTLLVIGVEQVLGSATEDGVELPRQVDRVLDAGVHSLTADGRVDVGGVTGEEGPSVPVVLDLALVAVEPGRSSRSPVPRPRGPSRGRAPHDVGLVDLGGFGHLTVAVPGHRAVPAVAVGGEKAERVPGARAHRQPPFGRRPRRQHVGQHDRGEHRFAGERHVRAGPAWCCARRRPRSPRWPVSARCRRCPSPAPPG